MISDQPLNCSTADLFSSVKNGVRGRKKLLVGPEEITYREIFDTVPGFCEFFRARNLKYQDRVLLSADNDADMTVISLALFICGLVSVPINPDAALDEVRKVLKLVPVKGIIADRGTIGIWQRHGICDGIELVLPVSPPRRNTLRARLLGNVSRDDSLEDEYPGILRKYGASDTLPPDASLSHTATILPTSGTTGEAKAVRLTGRNLVAQARIMAGQIAVNEDSCILNLLPFSHVDAFANGVLTAFISGASLCRPVKFSNQSIPDILDSIYRYKVTHFILVPTMLSLILKLGTGISEAFNTDRFRYFISTGAQLPEHLWRTFEGLVNRKIINFYGLTEANNLFFCGPDQNSRKIGSIGKPVACEAKITDESGGHAANGVCGELAVKGDTVMAGYYDNDNATALAIRGGWFFTGDIAIRDEDGFYSIIGRKKDLIISGGLNIFPDEINNALLSYPGVMEAATFGLPDEIWGEKTVSCVVSKDGSPLSDRDIKMFLREKISEYKIPKDIHVVSGLPKGPSGKVIKDDLIKMIEKGYDDKPFVPADIHEAVLTIASKNFAVPLTDLHLHTGPGQCSGWDSMAHLGFVVSLEKHFNVTFQPSDIVRMDSLEKGIEIIKNKLKDGRTQIER